MHIYDVVGMTSAQVYTGGGRHFGEVLVPATVDDTIFADGFEGALAPAASVQ